MFTPALCDSLPLTTLHGPPLQHLLSCVFVSACDLLLCFVLFQCIRSCSRWVIVCFWVLHKHVGCSVALREVMYSVCTDRYICINLNLFKFIQSAQFKAEPQNNHVLRYKQAVTLLRRLVADLSPRRPGFTPGSFHVGFVVDKVALGQVSSDFLGFSLSL
jgi:hypothetical protein